MTHSLRSIAESRFAALTRRETTAMSTVQTEQTATQEKTARLRALRLETEAKKLADRTAELQRRRAR